MNDTQLWLYISFALLGLFIVFITLSFCISSHLFKKRNRLIEDSLISTRVFVIDVKRDLVRYFDRISLKNQALSSLSDFYNQFPADERLEVVLWIKELLDAPKEAPKYFEIRRIVKRRDKTFSLPCQLQVQKIDPKKGLIHLESCLLKNMSRSHVGKKDHLYNFLTIDAFNRLFKKSNKNKGISFVFDFTEKSSLRNRINAMYFSQIKDVFSKFISNTIFMREIDERAIVVYCKHINAQNRGNNFILSLKKEVDLYLKTYSLSGRILYNIVATNNKECGGDPDFIVSKLIEISDSVERDDELLLNSHASSLNSDIHWLSQTEISVDSNDKKSYQNEVKKYIPNNNADSKIKIIYRPIVDCTNLKEMGYMMDARLMDTTSFAKISDLKNYAFKSDDETRLVSRDLFRYIASNGVNKFINEVASLDSKKVLFLPLYFKERQYVARAFRSFEQYSSRIVLTFSERDLIDFQATNCNETISQLKILTNLEKSKHQLAIRISSNALVLSDEMYACFDFFIIDLNEMEKQGPNDQNATSLRAVLENLLSYRKPIIIINMASWNSIRHMLGLIENPLLSAETIAPYSDSLKPVSDKNMKKLDSLVKKEKGE